GIDSSVTGKELEKISFTDDKRAIAIKVRAEAECPDNSDTSSTELGLDAGFTRSKDWLRSDVNQTGVLLVQRGTDPFQTYAGYCAVVGLHTDDPNLTELASLRIFPLRKSEIDRRDSDHTRDRASLLQTTPRERLLETETAFRQARDDEIGVKLANEFRLAVEDAVQKTKLHEHEERSKHD